MKQSDNLTFNKDFLWGVGSSAYQVEGANNTAGRGPSIWDEFARQTGSIKDGDNAIDACDHYNKYPEDLLLMKELGTKAYKLSVAWPRVFPEGTGRINHEGLDFYDRLVDACLENSISPWITLYHWDLPSELQRKGGWLNKDSIQWFSDYTKTVVERLSDRVENWITINEPQICINLAMDGKGHAPGIKFPRKQNLQAGHHILMAQGAATQQIRATTKKKANVGWSTAAWGHYPVNITESDIEAARRSMFEIPDNDIWFLNNSWFTDAALLGEYPKQGIDLFKGDVPDVESTDFDLIREPVDFLGVNMYHGYPVTTDFPLDRKLNALYPREVGYPQTMMGWPIDPKALYWGTKYIYERYKKPVYITENGIASMDWVHRDGVVRDPQRVDFLSRYLAELRNAQRDGVDVRGYFHWTFTDNFEWDHGYSKRFGLVHINFETQKRTPKDSYYWYKDVIETNGGCVSDSEDMVDL